MKIFICLIVKKWSELKVNIFRNNLKAKSFYLTTARMMQSRTLKQLLNFFSFIKNTLGVFHSPVLEQCTVYWNTVLESLKGIFQQFYCSVLNGVFSDHCSENTEIQFLFLPS